MVRLGKITVVWEASSTARRRVPRAIRTYLERVTSTACSIPSPPREQKVGSLYTSSAADDFPFVALGRVQSTTHNYM